MRSRTSLLLLSLAACKDPPPKPIVDAAPPPPSATVAPSVTASVVPPTTASVSAMPASSELPAHAKPSACRYAYEGEQPFRGPAAMVVSGSELRLVANDTGKPRTYTVPIAPFPKGAKAVTPGPPPSFVGMRWPPCEIAGKFAYCQGAGGVLVRTVMGTSDSKQLSKSRANTRIAAAALGPDHSVVAFLEARHTSEGERLEAYVALDDKDPVKVSEDGAGATTMRFLQRGDSAVLVFLDTRTAMVPIHGRTIALKGSDLAVGPDTVMFVGGAPERGIDLAVTTAGKKSFALVPMPRETSEFGMATIAIEDPPKEDVGAVWSIYPNGLDPAPIAAIPKKDGTGAWVLRVRPEARPPGSPKILELGHLDEKGAFRAESDISSHHVTDLAMVEDSPGSLWMLFGDSTSTTLERLVCPTGGAGDSPKGH